uniref:Uncharacterized protein n=1 Tax=Ascaris lumbricoides TaxID=6252 RepID=A0A0M3I5B7_ASCLU
MTNAVKFFLGPDFVSPYRNSEIIIEVANGLRGEKRELCWKRTPKGRHSEYRRRYYEAQKHLIDGVEADRETICSQRSTASTKTDKGKTIVKKIFLIANCVFGSLNAIAFCLSPAYPSILVTAFFFVFDALRRTVSEDHSATINSLLSLLFGAVLSALLAASVTMFLLSPLASLHINAFSVYSVFILVLTALLLLIMLNMLHNFGADNSIVKQCALNVVTQALCCIAQIATRHESIGKWSDIVSCASLSFLTILSWILFPLVSEERRLKLNEYMARIITIALEHDRRIEEIRELHVEPFHERFLVEITIAFSAYCPLEEAIRSTAELRKKYIKLNYVYKAFVRCY